MLNTICIVADKNQLFHCYIPCPRPAGLAVSVIWLEVFLKRIVKCYDNIVKFSFLFVKEGLCVH